MTSLVLFQFENMQGAIDIDTRKTNALPVSSGSLPAMLRPFSRWWESGTYQHSLNGSGVTENR